MTKFSDLKLDPKVLQAIAGAGYETPTPIQAGAIPPALEGRDVLGIAQTGTGKTASFTLPMITLLGRGRARARMPRSLVLCPTRELAAQVAENFDTYASHTKLTKALLIGGVSFNEQDRLIDRGVDVLIATPGRLLDHFERGKLLLTGVQIMVVDEADRMLDMGFIPDIERIFQLTPFTRQTLFFSATMAPEIERITNTFLHAPERIEVARQATASETITQRLVEIKPTRRDQAVKQKRALLRALIDAEGAALTNAIIFCNRKTDVDIVAKSLKKHGYDAAAIHGDLNQSHRTRTLDDFREGKLKLLIASDVAARGLDIPAVSHVFNFDLPSHAEDYVHRIGRTGRAGRKGTSISLATPADDKYLSAIETLVNKAIARTAPSEGFSMEEKPRQNRNNRSEANANAPRQRHNEDRPPEQPNKRRDEAPKPRPNDGQRDNRNDRRGGRYENRGGAVMGMGDHVPQFMLVTLRAATDESVDRRPADDAEKPAASEAPARPSRRRKATRPTEDAAPSEVPETVVPAVTAEEPQKKPKRTPRKTAKAESTDEAGADAPSPAEAPKRRSRKPKAEATGETEAKPKRTRKKKADAPETDSGGDAEPQAEAPKPAVKRTRRKAKSAEGGEQPAASEPADS